MLSRPQNSVPAARANAYPWRGAWMVAGLVIVLAVWFVIRVYTYSSYQQPHNPLQHPMTRFFQDMAVSMSEGHGFGQINVSRIMRNKDASPLKPYPAESKPNDVYCQFKALDPGYGLIVYAARGMFFLLPDTIMRPLALQLLFDLLILLAIYATFYRWGWPSAVTAGVLYGLNVVFAYSMATPWYHCWDGGFCTLSFLGLLWLYRLSRRGTAKAPMICLALAIGLLLGAMMWIRSSWFVFAPVLFIGCLFSKTLRPWLGYVFLTYALLAGGMVVRSTMLNGHLSYSTRMSWFTAYEGLGRHPNPYGIEDDDLYMLERTQQDQGVNYDICDFNPQDKATQKDFGDTWRRDPGFVIRSIAQRAFSNVFFNFDETRHLFWNEWMLIFAWLGLLLGAAQMGEIGLLAGLSALMYITLNGAYAFVYYILRIYAFPTQMFLLFGATAAVAGLTQIARRGLSGHWPTYDRSDIGPANIIFALTALVMCGLLMPQAQKYLTPTQTVTGHWYSPDDVDVIPYLGLRSQIDALPRAQKERFMDYVNAHTKLAPGDHTDPLSVFIKQNLYYVTFSNPDDKTGILWINKKTNLFVYQVLMRTTKSIAGLGYEWIKAFDITDPNSWDGKQLRFKLLPNKVLPSKQAEALLRQKFMHWNWRLTSLGGGEYLAVLTSENCSATRHQLATYFNHQCGDADEPIAPPERED